ncbi:glycosyltransferase family 2 protein [Shewanella algidipiscicola]|uniref:glycosyltransferase family 2 protein n=2 Tax=Shewanella algidipiscicola TaxID=614070 RepID=UPI000E70CF75|nr:glycosyltransferase family 2 protein [Shewanella algidipiscicola]
MKTAIVIPAFNEQVSICEVLAPLLQMTEFDIIVVDDASTDHTLELVSANPQIIVLPLAVNIGAWKAMQTGIRYCHLNNYQRVITFDADGQHLANCIPALCCYQESSGHDVVIGSCPERGSIARHIAWKLFRALSGIKVEDLTSGLRVYGRAAIEILSTREASLLEYQDVGVLLMLKTFGLSFSEVPVDMNRRVDGISRIFYSWGAVAYYMTHTTLLCISKVRMSNELSYQKTIQNYTK